VMQYVYTHWHQDEIFGGHISQGISNFEIDGTGTNDSAEKQKESCQKCQYFNIF